MSQVYQIALKTMPETLFDSVFDLASLTITDENITLLRENQEFISYLRHVSAPPKCPYVDIFPSENKLIEAPESGIRFLLSAEGEITGSKLNAGIDERYYIKSFVPPVDPNDRREANFCSLFKYRGYLLLVIRYTSSVSEFRTSGDATRIWALTYDDKVESFERKIEGRELFVPKQFSCLLDDSTITPSLVLWRREGEKSQLLRLGDVEGNSFVITACKSSDVKHSISIMKESMWKNSFARQQNIALDKKGNVWISSGRRLYVFSSRFELIAQQEPEEFVSIFSSPDGNVLCKNKWSPKIYSLDLLHLPKDCKQEMTRKDK